jgi:hypothetical protein
VCERTPLQHATSYGAQLDCIRCPALTFVVCSRLPAAVVQECIASGYTCPACSAPRAS